MARLNLLARTKIIRRRKKGRSLYRLKKIGDSNSSSVRWQILHGKIQKNAFQKSQKDKSTVDK